MNTKTVFLSYPRQDITYAKWLGRIFEINGITAVLSDYDNYDIETAVSDIQRCDAFVYLYSRNTRQIDNQSTETEFAFNAHKSIFSVMLTDCEVEGQYNYYLSQGERFEIYKNKAKNLRLLVGRIKNIDSDCYKKNKLQSYHIELLDEGDIDRILSGEREQKKFTQKLSPFYGLYSKHPTVNFALRCYSVIWGLPFAIFALMLLLGLYGIFTGLLFGESFTELPAFLTMWLVEIMLVLLWNLSYYPSIYIAKLGVKSKALIVVITVLSVFLAFNIISSVGSAISLISLRLQYY